MDFFPLRIRSFTNFVTRRSWNFGSGRILRLATTRRRGIFFYPLRPPPAPRGVLGGASSWGGESGGPPGVRGKRSGECCEGDQLRAQLGRLAPYLERLCLRPATPTESSVPRMMW